MPAPVRILQKQLRQLVDTPQALLRPLVQIKLGLQDLVHDAVHP